MIPAIALVAGAVLGWAARHFRVLSWAAASVASLLGLRWFITAHHCPGCGHAAHLMRPAGRGEWRCVLHCRKPSAPQDAPDRTESAGRVLPGVPGWARVPGHVTKLHSEDRTGEGQ